MRARRALSLLLLSFFFYVYPNDSRIALGPVGVRQGFANLLECLIGAGDLEWYTRGAYIAGLCQRGRP